MNWIRTLFGLRPRYKAPEATDRTPAAELNRPDLAPALSDTPPAPPIEVLEPAPDPQKVNAEDVLHRPLLEKLATFERHSLRRGQIVFHGCALSSEYTDVAARRLGGTRKWASEDASYACDYGGAFNRKAGETGHLWVCRIRQDVPAFIGRQRSLIEHSPWGAGFPWQFPNVFERYGHDVLGVRGPVALLDHQGEEGFAEILLTSPELALEVVDVITLPDAPEEAKALGRTLNEKYAALLPSYEVSVC